MALVLADRVLETTTVTGTGDASLSGAQANYQPFSVIGNTNTTYYTIVDNTNNSWEVGVGTYVLAGNKITRDTVLSSSNGGALVYFASGSKDIFLDLPSEKVLLTTSTTGTGSVVLATGATQDNPTISNYENFTSTTAPSYLEGRIWYDSTQHSLTYYNDATNSLVHVGQEVQTKVINNTGSAITIGAPVYVTSTSSGQIYPNVALAKANSVSTSSVLGLATQSIANGAIGYVTSYGILQPCNTGLYNVGDVLYLSPYTAGVLMNTIPPTGNVIIVGVVAYKNSPNGSIYVKQQNSYIVSAGTITGTVAVANGGTGVTTSTGTGSVVLSDSPTFNGTIRQQTYTVVNLPTGIAGARSFVTDCTALTALFGTQPVGGSTVNVPVYHDGTVWRVG